MPFNFEATAKRDHPSTTSPQKFAKNQNFLNPKNQLKLNANTTKEDLTQQHRYIRFLNATYPIKWKDAVPELKDWDPEN